MNERPLHDSFLASFSGNDILSFQEHCDISISFLNGKVDEPGYIYSILRSYEFQIGNRSYLDELLFEPISNSMHTTLSDKSLGGCLIEIFSENNSSLAEHLRACIDFTKEDCILYPVRTASIYNQLFLTHRSCILDDGTKGISATHLKSLSDFPNSYPVDRNFVEIESYRPSELKVWTKRAPEIHQNEDASLAVRATHIALAENVDSYLVRTIDRKLAVLKKGEFSVSRFIYSQNKPNDLECIWNSVQRGRVAEI